MARKAKGKGKQGRQRTGYDMESKGQGEAGRPGGKAVKAESRERYGKGGVGLATC